MKEHAFLKWMSEETATDWCNDSALPDDLDAALASGAIGCTTNPPLTYQVLTAEPEHFAPDLAQIANGVTGDAKVVGLIGVVVRKIAKRLEALFEETDRTRGYVRTQVAPPLSADGAAMLAMGKIYASWGPNVKVKIPGTCAGIRVLEELTALGIPTNPTVCVSLSQMIAAAEAHERGLKRAQAAGLDAPHSTSAFVMGRLQDYLALLSEERGLGLATYDLECAVLAVAKRCCHLFEERGYRQQIMPAAFRSARQVAELTGSKTVMTIHPSIQDRVTEADQRDELKRRAAIDDPVDPQAVDRVYQALPEFRVAYEPGGIAVEDFDSFGATAMTLKAFNETGWQKLKTFEIPSAANQNG